MSDYDILKAAGHGAAKAAEIAMDAKRGDNYATSWIEACRSSLRSKRSKRQAHPKQSA